MPFNVFRADAPMSKSTKGAAIAYDSVDITTDSNGAGNTRIDFSGSIPNDSITADSAIVATSNEFCDIRWDKLLSVAKVDVYVQNAPASTTITVDVVLMAER